MRKKQILRRALITYRFDIKNRYEKQYSRRYSSYTFNLPDLTDLTLAKWHSRPRTEHTVNMCEERYADLDLRKPFKSVGTKQLRNVYLLNQQALKELGVPQFLKALGVVFYSFIVPLTKLDDATSLVLFHSDYAPESAVMDIPDEVLQRIVVGTEEIYYDFSDATLEVNTTQNYIQEVDEEMTDDLIESISIFSDDLLNPVLPLKTYVSQSGILVGCQPTDSSLISNGFYIDLTEVKRICSLGFGNRLTSICYKRDDVLIPFKHTLLTNWQHLSINELFLLKGPQRLGLLLSNTEEIFNKQLKCLKELTHEPHPFFSLSDLALVILRGTTTDEQLEYLSDLLVYLRNQDTQPHAARLIALNTYAIDSIPHSADLDTLSYELVYPSKEVGYKLAVAHTATSLIWQAFDTKEVIKSENYSANKRYCGGNTIQHLPVRIKTDDNIDPIQVRQSILSTFNNPMNWCQLQLV